MSVFSDTLNARMGFSHIRAVIHALLCIFLMQGLTGADGHQQRTDYVLSTSATAGRYSHQIFHLI